MDSEDKIKQPGKRGRPRKLRVIEKTLDMNGKEQLLASSQLVSHLLGSQQAESLKKRNTKSILKEISESEEEEEDKKGYFEVEKVVDYRVERVASRKREIQLLIKWRGYKKPTWEKMVTFARDSPHCL